MYWEYWDRHGNPISQERWIALIEAGEKRVAETTVGGYWVSTVWLGLNHRFSENDPPIIFETMVFTSQEHLGDLDQRRYCTEEEALAGHAEIVANLQALVDSIDVPTDMPEQRNRRSE